MVLSEKVVLVYILAESGVRGRLTAGRVERDPSGRISVFDARGEGFEYLSGERLRSWCLIGAEGQPVEGWREIQPEDLPRMFSA
jgi:hypothetical protein